MKLRMIRRGDTLVPAAEMFLDDLRTISENQPLDVSATRSRSVPHHRRFFAKLRKLRQSGAWEQDEESLLSYVKIGIGHVVSVVDNSSTLVGATNLLLAEELLAKHGPASKEGKLARFIISIAGPKSYLVPKSISFEAMDESAFKDFETRADKFIAEKFGIDPEELMREAAALVAEEPEQPADPPPRPAEAPLTANVVEKSYNAVSEPVEDRLTRLALKLAQESEDEVNRVWRALRVETWVLKTYRESEMAVKVILEACRGKAAGRVTKAQFDAAVNEAIERAMGVAG